MRVEDQGPERQVHGNEMAEEQMIQIGRSTTAAISPTLSFHSSGASEAVVTLEEEALLDIRGTDTPGPGVYGMETPRV